VYFEATVMTTKAWRVGWMAQGSSAMGVNGLGCSVGLDASGPSLTLWRDGRGAPFDALPTAEPTAGEGSMPLTRPLPPPRTLRGQVGSVVGCLLELASGVVRFAMDGVLLGVADAGGWCGKSLELCPAATLAPDAGCSLNLGATPFAFRPPKGYVSWADAAANSRGGSAAAGGGSGGSMLEAATCDTGGGWCALAECPSLWSDTVEKPPLPSLPTCLDGCLHWEFVVTGGLFGGTSCAIGVCCLESPLGQSPLGQGDRPPGHDAHSWVYLSSGEKMHGEKVRSFGPAWRSGDVIGLELDSGRGMVKLNHATAKHIPGLSQMCASTIPKKYQSLAVS
jgi:hypothetical protein